MAGQHRAGEVVEASRTRLAPIPLPVSLGLVKAVSDHATAAAGGAVHPLRPALLAHQGEALGIVDQCREVDQNPVPPYWRVLTQGGQLAPSSPTITKALQAGYPDLLPPPRNPIRAKVDRLSPVRPDCRLGVIRPFYCSPEFVERIGP